jgi:carbohydrate kinase (thermoresistant glucokinase family)
MSGAIVVMGVSGCGKSTLARALADTLGWRFVEGDDLHPAANIAKMASGIPLDDRDREPFLRNVADAIAESREAGVVVACSALKRAYRDLIRSRAGAIMLVLPRVSRAELDTRLASRPGHFMPPCLLDSQLAVLERPEADEQSILTDGNAPVAAQLAEILATLPADMIDAGTAP